VAATFYGEEELTTELHGGSRRKDDFRTKTPCTSVSSVVFFWSALGG